MRSAVARAHLLLGTLLLGSGLGLTVAACAAPAAPQTAPAPRTGLADAEPRRPAGSADAERSRALAAPVTPAARSTPAALALSRKEAIVRAIANNPDLAGARIEVDIAMAAIDQARAEFEPHGFLGVEYGRFRRPTFQQAIPDTDPPVTFQGLPPGLQVDPSEMFGWHGGVRSRTVLGLGLEARYDLNRRTTASAFALDPSYTPTLSLLATQPLLQGFGPAVNRAFIRIASLGHAASRRLFQDAALGLALAVEDAYWGLAFAIESLRVAEQSLVTARQLAADTRVRLEAGIVRELDVLSAESGVAAREEQVIGARNDVQNAQDLLLRLIMPPGALERWNVRIVLTDSPRIDAEGIDVDGALVTAFERRPDLEAAELQVETESVRLSRARHDLLPRLDLTGTYTYSGLGDSHDDAHDALFGGRFHDWSVELGFEVPLGYIGPRANRDEAEARRRQAQRQREGLEQEVVLDVRTAARDIEAARERVRASEVSVELAERQLEAEQDLLRVGAATSFEVLQREEELVSARTAEIGARIDFVRARARFARAQGVLLEAHDIAVD